MFVVVKNCANQSVLSRIYLLNYSPFLGMNIKYKRSDRWNLVYENGQLIVTAGADELYLISDLDSRKSKKLYEEYKNDSLMEIAEDEEYNSVLRKLEKSGVIYRDRLLASKNIKIQLRWVGGKDEAIQSLLEKYIHDSDSVVSLVGTNEEPDLLIIVRRSGLLTEVLKAYKDLQVPHLFVDLAYDHTVSLGPLVFPGETACLACFVGRVTRGWGDIQAPEKPNVTRRSELIAGLIFSEVRDFAEQGTCLALLEKVWTMNILQMITKVDSLFRLPWCPFCYPEKQEEGVGSFELPWITRDSQK